MNLRELADALRELLDWLRWERESLEEFHRYGQMFGAMPGSNVFTFVLEDALRQRGMTLQQFNHAATPYQVEEEKSDVPTR